MTLPALISYVRNMCSYIAGYVVRQFLPLHKCAICRELLVLTRD